MDVLGIATLTTVLLGKIGGYVALCDTRACFIIAETIRIFMLFNEMDKVIIGLALGKAFLCKG